KALISFSISSEAFTPKRSTLTTGLSLAWSSRPTWPPSFTRASAALSSLPSARADAASNRRTNNIPARILKFSISCLVLLRRTSFKPPPLIKNSAGVVDVCVHNLQAQGNESWGASRGVAALLHRGLFVSLFRVTQQGSVLHTSLRV